MKTSNKIVAAALAAALGVGGLGIAIATPYVNSKTTSDIYSGTTSAQDVYWVVDKNDPDYQKLLKICQQIVTDMLGYSNVEAYFKAQPNGDDLLAQIRSYAGDGKLDVNEISPAKIKGDFEGKGDIEFKLHYPTKYKAGAKVAVLIGIVGADGKTVEWHVFEGVADENGDVVFTLNSEKDAAVLKAAAEGRAVTGVASTPSAIA